MPSRFRFLSAEAPAAPRGLRNFYFGIGGGRVLVLLLTVWLGGEPGRLARGDERPAAAPSSLAAPLAVIEQAFVQTIEQAERSVVAIARDKPRPPDSEDFDERILRRGRREPTLADPNYIPNEFGTGVIVRGDGLILTNYHVVRGGPAVGKEKTEQELYVRLADRRGFPARILAADPRSDLAVLKIEATTLPAVRLGNGTQARKGQLLIVLGNPYSIARDGSASASWGILSNIGRPAHQEIERFEDSRRKETIHHLGTLWQIDARLNLGTSGGPVFNFKGEMVALTTSLAALSGYEKSAGFAVPVTDQMLRVIETLMRGEEVEYGFLGISPGDTDLFSPIPNVTQRTGVLVEGVYPHSPAGLGGVLNGDIILALNGRPILSRTELMREIALLAPETVVKLRVWRFVDKEVLDLSVSLGKWPVQDDEGIIATRRKYPAWRGVTIDYNTARYRFLPLQFRGRGDFPKAVLVTAVEPASAAAQADLHVGDFITQVNQQPVQSPREFLEAVQAAKGNVQLTLEGNRRVELKGP